MTSKTERWIFVGACALVYAGAMIALAAIIRDPVRWGVNWLIALLGANGTLTLFAVVWLVGVAWLIWSGRNDVQAPPPKLPRWLRLSINVFLALVGAIFAVGLFAMVFFG